MSSRTVTTLTPTTSAFTASFLLPFFTFEDITTATVVIVTTMMRSQLSSLAARLLAPRSAPSAFGLVGRARTSADIGSSRSPVSILPLRWQQLHARFSSSSSSAAKAAAIGINTTPTVSPDLPPLAVSSLLRKDDEHLDDFGFEAVHDPKIHFPVIDVSALINPNASKQELSTVAEQIYDICTKEGFFYVKNHGISKDLVRSVFKMSKGFLNKPLKYKNQFRAEQASRFRGYFSMGAETTNGKKDLKESWDYFTESADAAEIKHELLVPNRWPDQPPEFQAIVEEYVKQIRQLGAHVMHGICLSLHADRHSFDHLFEVPWENLRLLRYPPQAKGEKLIGNKEELGIGIGSHCDWGALTFIAQAENIPSLQVQKRSGEWVVVPPIPDTFIVNIGDCVQLLTNNMYQSTPHRVVNSSNRTRHSIAYFFEPSLEAILYPNNYREHAAPIGFKPLNYSEHLMRALNRSFSAKY